MKRGDKFNKVFKIVLILFFCLLSLSIIAAALIINTFGNMGDCAGPPEKLFEYITYSPLPDYVTDVEGGGYCWQDYSIWLKFSSDERFIEDLKSLGYVQTKWETVSGNMVVADEFSNNFSLSWEPENVSNKACYILAGPSKWGYVVFDVERHVFYVHIHDV